MPYKELHRFSDDQRLLITVFESANDVSYTVCRSLELIEQSRTILRELDRARPHTVASDHGSKISFRVRDG
jgi:hypothetical protein